MRLLPGRIILNDADPAREVVADPHGLAAEAVAEDLQRSMLGAVGAFATSEGKLDYVRLRASGEWSLATACSRRLGRVDPGDLAGREARLAFWINVYNALVFHGIVALRVRRSVREVWGFFGRVSYRIGDMVLSADEIEHGVLRGNRRRVFPPLRCFGARDPRAALPIDPVDPRIHFAITCGARSCPPVGVYRAQAIDRQLDLAARNFVNQEVMLDGRGRVCCSKILRWYGADFDTAGGLGPFLLRHLDEGPARGAVARQPARPCRRYHAYDWGLQHKPAP